ncbi:DUF1902 domain-containing protein [Lelliottia wanjuensis]|uniref:DUF1902 domain-containing protein n=1 Tax=Lelliottia wanjuensis TaxID=3050585 RepID=UPI00254CCDB4|nr:DUF1902 domain-containing protein [Lelliottia sp. V104_15]MDK9607127.1 DUF1902 domain-containing protein [Lelliottia sp. V104_15]
MPNVVNLNATRKRRKKLNTPTPRSPFIVNVTHHDSVWIADCDELGLTTEAATQEALIERVNLIAPELCEANGLCDGEDDLHIEFVHDQNYGNSRIAL